MRAWQTASTGISNFGRSIVVYTGLYWFILVHSVRGKLHVSGE